MTPGGTPFLVCEHRWARSTQAQLKVALPYAAFGGHAARGYLVTVKGALLALVHALDRGWICASCLVVVVKHFVT